MYVFYDSNGKIIGAVSADSESVQLTRIPDGTTALYLDDTQYSDVWANMAEYTIQNELPVSTPIPDDVKLQNAKNAKLTEIENAMNETLVGGFVSKTTGHTYPSNDKAQGNFLGILKAFELNPNKTSASFLTLDAGFVSHSKDDFQTVYLEGDEWKEAQYAQFAQLQQQIESATDINTVLAITWTPATY